MTDYQFNKDFVTGIKKDIINYVSRTSTNVNKITFNLSLYTNFVINNDDNTAIKVTYPNITLKKIIPAKIEIGARYFEQRDNEYYIKPEYEDLLIEKITNVLVIGASLKLRYDGAKPISIDGVGVITNDGDGFDHALSKIISEDINDYNMPDFNDIDAYNKGIVRMILSIIGYKYAIHTYFNHDKSLYMALYSLSVDSNLFGKINKKLTLIKNLISIANSKELNKTEVEKEIIEKLIHTKQVDLINLIINKLYIPYINTVPFDKRKQVRDEILRGFLGPNYVNLKLTDENKQNYYWASLIKNSVPINNKVNEQVWATFRTKTEKETANNMLDIYTIDSKNKSKNNIKDFWVYIDNDKVTINNGKKNITDKNLVLEMLSYAYISSIDDDLKEKIEKGIIMLCSKNKIFTSKLNNNPLSNRMLAAAIIQLAKKNGYNIELINIIDNVANFKVKEPV